MNTLKHLIISSAIGVTTLAGCTNKISEPAIDQVMKVISANAHSQKKVADILPKVMTNHAVAPPDATEDDLQPREPDEMEKLTKFIALESTGAYVSCGKKPQIIGRREVYTACINSPVTQKASASIKSLMKTTLELEDDLQTFGAREAAVDPLFADSHLLYKILEVDNVAISEAMLHQRRAVADCIKDSQEKNIDTTYYQDPYLPDDYPPNNYLKMNIRRREAVIPVDVKNYCNDREAWINAFQQGQVTGTKSPATYDMLPIPLCLDYSGCDWNFKQYEQQ